MVMPTMSDSRRKGIQRRQRKQANASKRAAKIAKKERNKAPAGKSSSKAAR
jgi:hypothetical protein